MGCDIHFVVEHKANDVWVGVYSTDLTPGLPTIAEQDNPKANPGYARVTTLQNRNYKAFAKLAGVRGQGPDAKGMPADASSLADRVHTRWRGDGHSHSYCSLQDFVTASMTDEQFADFAAAELDKRPEHINPTLAFWVGYADSNIDEYRVVFWFDN